MAKTLEDKLARLFLANKDVVLSHQFLMDNLSIKGETMRIMRLVYNLKKFRGMEIERVVKQGYKYTGTTAEEEGQLSLLENPDEST